MGLQWKAGIITQELKERSFYFLFETVRCYAWRAGIPCGINLFTVTPYWNLSSVTTFIAPRPTKRPATTFICGSTLLATTCMVFLITTYLNNAIYIIAIFSFGTTFGVDISFVRLITTSGVTTTRTRDGKIWGTLSGTDCACLFTVYILG